VNRRQFLRFAGGPIAAAIALPELARTIILPPRGGWPVGGADFSRYLTSSTTWHLAELSDTARTLTFHRYSNPALTAAEMRKVIGPMLEKMWREAYDVGLPDPVTGERVPFRTEWQDLFA
jgi:hypothetical protein